MTNQQKTEKLTPVSFENVRITGSFWKTRQETVIKKSLPLQYASMKKTGHIDAFKLAWKPGQEPVPHIFWDSDLAKWIESVSYSLVIKYDKGLDRVLDGVIDLIASAQLPDGYLNSHFISVEPDRRWTNLRDNHELYCAGHLIEAAAAHFRATGKRKLLDVIRRYVDHIGKTFGAGPGQKRGYCGHEEIELALYKLYKLTGEEKHLGLCRYFVDERGAKPYYFDKEAVERGEDPSLYHFKTYAYMQADKPLRELDHVDGHAVRAMYIYSAMADLAGELQDKELRAACERIWENLVGKNMYITGGIGPSRHNEGFTKDYDLPNETAYCETCASAGLIFWNHRMLHLDCDSKYADVTERILYNALLSGISLEGDRFFYENPLASSGTHHRQEWYSCACCPPNITRLIVSLGQYIYSTATNEIAVHQYIGSSVKLNPEGKPVEITQETDYPWNGNISLHIDPAEETELRVKLRLPGWCTKFKLTVNGKPVKFSKIKGYLCVDRKWRPGDTVGLKLDMPAQRIYSNPEVKANLGRAAIQRGPIVYCIESADNKTPPERIFLPRKSVLKVSYDKRLLGGINVVNASGLGATDPGPCKNTLYGTEQPGFKKIKIKAIPYYAWDNRKPGEMAVWLKENALADPEKNNTR